MLTLEKPLLVTSAKANQNALNACPEEALEIVESDEAADKRFNDALEKLPAQTEQLTTTVKNKDWKPLLAKAEKRSEKVTEKLQALKQEGTFTKTKIISFSQLSVFFVTSQ